MDQKNGTKTQGCRRRMPGWIETLFWSGLVAAGHIAAQAAAISAIRQWAR